LREVAENLGVQAFLIGSADELRPEQVLGKKRIGVTAGASAPEVLVEALVQRLQELGAGSIELLDGLQEHVRFPLPKGLGD
jgi:4-hydroxy-3-methylbut-2-enyl diphosphate reductase